jgi:hypothetical protein
MWLWSGFGTVAFSPDLECGEEVLRPSPSLSVHPALPAPLVSEVIYVKIKPLETEVYLGLFENPTTSGWTGQVQLTAPPNFMAPLPSAPP